MEGVERRRENGYAGRKVGRGRSQKGVGEEWRRGRDCKG